MVDYGRAVWGLQPVIKDIRKAMAGLGLGLALLAPASDLACAETWTASYQFQAGDPRDEAMRGIARGVAEAGLDIRLFSAGSLLRPNDQWAALLSGSVDLIFLPTDYLLDRFPQLAVLSLPGVVRTPAQAERVAMSPAMRDLKHQIEAAGVVILADSWVPGAFASRKRCVVHPKDAKGLRARTIGDFMSEFWTAAGAVSVPATTSETMPTLVSSGLIDIANTSALTLLALRMESRFACLTLPGTSGALWYLYEPILVSRHRFDALDEPQRLALLAAAAKAQASLAAGASQYERRLAGNYVAAGVEVVALDAEALAEWYRLAKRTAWKLFRQQVPGGSELLDHLQAVE